MVSDSLIIVKKSNGTYNRHTTEAGVCILKVLFSRSRKESQTIRLTGSPIVCKHAQRTSLGARTRTASFPQTLSAFFPHLISRLDSHPTGRLLGTVIAGPLHLLNSSASSSTRSLEISGDRRWSTQYTRRYGDVSMAGRKNLD
jgi:hypothetical protein